MEIHWHKIFGAFSLSVIFGIGVSQMVTPAYAHHLLPKHRLDCSRSFPCPAAMKPRMRFWVEVFRNWDEKTAILHDSARPERVYAVFNSGHGCYYSARARIKVERKKVQEALRVVAAKIDAGQELTNQNEIHLAALFSPQNPKVIRAAAKKIRCQGGVRDSFLRGLQRFNRYRPMVDKIIKENKLPADIRYLPFVESSYNPAAYSKAGAAGMWQIMPKNARVLGLELNAALDERFDPEAATRAAVKYLKSAERRLSTTAYEIHPGITKTQINPFVITSYNYGVNGMKRAMRQVAPDFMAVMDRYKSPRFQIAVQNFYASFLAARHVARNSRRYFGKVPKESADTSQIVILQRPTSIDRIEEVFGVSAKQLRPLNRVLTRFVWRGWRLIPAGYHLRLPYKKDRWQPEVAKLASLAAEKAISGGDYYKVRRGDTACGIAKAVKVECRELIRANRLGKKAVIHIGQKLIIPFQPGAASFTYRVRKNDTACGIAKSFGVGCQTFLRHNRLSNTTKIHPGQKLLVPGSAFANRKPTTSSFAHRVRKNDTACGIAKRFKVGCQAFLSYNGLSSTTKIHPGQKLFIPGTDIASRKANALNVNKQYVVRKGDSVCQVAKIFAVGCSELRALNQLSRSEFIHPGQKLKIPGSTPKTDQTTPSIVKLDAEKLPVPTSEPKIDFPNTAATLRAPTNETVSDDSKELLNLLDTLPDLTIAVTHTSGQPVYSVRVEADETLGHFADWLGMDDLRAVRNLNNLFGTHSIATGRQLLLPVRDAKMAEQFEERRTEYHQVLSESLKEHYNLVGIESYTVKRGDSLWLLSQQLGFPVWLLYRVNPSLRDTPLKPGQTVALPKLKEKIKGDSERS